MAWKAGSSQEIRRTGSIHATKKSQAMIHHLARQLAMRTGKSMLYRRLCRPNGKDWAEYLRRHGGLYHLGKDCSILPEAKIIDPQCTWIGDRVNLGNCRLVCHDGSIAVLYQRYGLKIDRYGPIIIENDVFVGEGAILLGGTVIGEGSIIGAGSVVRQRIAPGSVVTGNPARTVARIDDVRRFWEAESAALPWARLIESREGIYDSAIEPELRRLRQEHFFKNRDRR